MLMWLVPNHYCTEVTSAMKEVDVRHVGRNDVHEKRNVVENTELLLKFKDLKERNKEDSMYYKPCCLNTEYFFWSPPPHHDLFEVQSLWFLSDQAKLFFSSLMPLNVVFHLTKYGCSGKKHSCPSVCWLYSCSEGSSKLFWTCWRNLSEKYGNIKVSKLQSSLK